MYEIEVYVDFWHTEHLHSTAFQFLIAFLKISLFLDFFMWYGKVF